MPVRPLPQLADDTVVLVDANIFIYAARGASPQCEELLRRCAREEIRGVTTLEVLAEVCHQLMLASARASGAVTQATASALRHRREAVRGLTDYWPTVEAVLDSNLTVLTLDGQRFRHAQIMRERHGLLTNDSLVLAAADSYGITNLATRDADFDDVPWLTVYKPEDIA